MKKLLSWMLVAVMMLSALPVSAFAAQGIADGNYHVDIKLMKVGEDKASMADGVLAENRQALVTFADGKVTNVQMGTGPMKAMGIMTSAVTEMNVKGQAVDVLETAPVMAGGTEYQYLKLLRFDLPQEAQPAALEGETAVPVSFKAPGTPMGDKLMEAELVLNWASAMVTDEKPVQPPIADGNYYVPVSLVKDTSDDASMADKVLDESRQVLVSVKDGKAVSVQLSTSPMTVMGMTSAVTEMTVAGEAVEVVKTAPFTTKDGTEYQYLQLVKFALPEEAQPQALEGATYVPVSFVAPGTPMSGTMTARLKLDWSSAEATDEKPVQPPVADGNYYVAVSLVKDTSEDASMADKVLDESRQVLVSVQDGKVVSVQLATSPMTVMGMTSAVTEMTVAGEAVEVVKTAPFTTKDGTEYQYLQLVKFALPEEAQPQALEGATYAPVSFVAPGTPMSGTMTARLKLDWASAKATQDTELAVPGESEPQEPQKITVTLTYDANGGVNAPEAQSAEIALGELAFFEVTSAEPTREGYTFLGWSINPKDASVLLHAGSPLNAQDDLTLFAIWEENKTPAAPIADGNYYMNVYLWNLQENSPSMSDMALEGNRQVLVTVQGGKVTQVMMATGPVSMAGYVSAVTEMTVNEVPVTVLKTGKFVSQPKGIEHDYLKLFTFGLPESAQPEALEGESFVPVAFRVPDTIMGDGMMMARLKLDWSSAEATQDTELAVPAEPLSDGSYYVPVSLVKENNDSASMADKILDNSRQVLVSVQDGKVTGVQLATSPMTVLGMTSAVTEMTVAGEDVDVVGEAYFKLNGAALAYLQQVKFALPQEAQPEALEGVTYVPVSFVAPGTPMGDAPMSARLKLDWSGAVATKDTKLVPPAAPEVVLTLTFDANGGEGAPAAMSAPLDGATVAFIIPEEVPTREGYTFVGWEYGDFDLQPGQQLNTQKDMTLSAVWEEIPQEITITLSYDANGGENAPEAQSVTITEGMASFEVSSVVPTRDGYTFLGWSLDEEDASELYHANDNLRTEGSVTLYAMWEEIAEPEPENPDQPQNPDQPDQPENPNQPDPQPEDKPEVPEVKPDTKPDTKPETQPDAEAETEESEKAPETGDSTSLVLLGGLALACAAGVVVMVSRKRREN